MTIPLHQLQAFLLAAHLATLQNNPQIENPKALGAINQTKPITQPTTTQPKPYKTAQKKFNRRNARSKK